MDTARRMQLIRTVQKIEQNPEFSRKLGIADKSNFKPDRDQKVFRETFGSDWQREVTTCYH